MLELLLLRHAKSRWDEPSVADHDRDLAPRGRKAASRMGELLREQDLVPDLVLCSTARRAEHTWQLAAAALERRAAGPPRRAALSCLTRADDSRSPASMAAMRGGCCWSGMIRGCIGWLCDSGAAGDADLRARLAAKFPTGGLALLAIDIAAWAELRHQTGELRGFWRPRDLGVAGD